MRAEKAKGQHGGARPGAGRPALPVELARSQRVMVNLSPSERAGLQALARAEGRSEADVLRRLLVLALQRRPRRRKA